MLPGHMQHFLKCNSHDSISAPPGCCSPGRSVHLKTSFVVHPSKKNSLRSPGRPPLFRLRSGPVRGPRTQLPIQCTTLPPSAGRAWAGPGPSGRGPQGLERGTENIQDFCKNNHDLCKNSQDVCDRKSSCYKAAPTQALGGLPGTNHVPPATGQHQDPVSRRWARRCHCRLAPARPGPREGPVPGGTSGPGGAGPRGGTRCVSSERLQSRSTCPFSTRRCALQSLHALPGPGARGEPPPLLAGRGAAMPAAPT